MSVVVLFLLQLLPLLLANVRKASGFSFDTFRNATTIIRAWKRPFALFDGVKYPIKPEEIPTLGLEVKQVSPSEFMKYPADNDDFVKRLKLISSPLYKDHYLSIDLNKELEVRKIINKGRYILCENSFGLASRLRLLAGMMHVASEKLNKSRVVQVWVSALPNPQINTLNHQSHNTHHILY